MGGNKVGDRGLKRLNIFGKGKDEANYLPAIVVVIAVLAIAGVGIYLALESGPKAEFEVASLTLSPAEAKVGQTVTVSTVVKNNGDATETYGVVLTIDGAEIDAKEVTLAPDETKTITFTIVKNVEGTYTVGVGGLTKSLNVNPLTPATFEVSNLVLNPREAEVGEPVVISATVKNVGELEGTYTAELKIDGATEAIKDVTLAGGATKTISFTVTKDARGTYTVGVDGLQRTLSVLEPATFEFTNLTISPTEVKLGDSVEISVDVRNTGDMSGTYTVTLRINGVTEATKDVTLTGGATETASFTVTKNEAKTYDVSIDGLTNSFSVVPISEQVYTRTYSFEPYPSGFSCTLTIQIPVSTYDYYRSLSPAPMYGDLSKISETVVVDSTITYIVSEVKSKVIGGEEQLANALLTFCQSIPNDEEIDFEHLPKYPVEILVEGAINCVEWAQICGTLMYAADLDVVFMAWKQPDSKYLGHVVVGVHLANPPEHSYDMPPNYCIYGGKRYYIADATGYGYVGDLRDDLVAGGWHEQLYDIVPVK